MADFSILLGKRVDEAKPPKLLPPGNYEGIVQKYEVREAKYSQDGDPVPVVTFNIQLTQAGEDVDPEELVEEDGSRVDLTKRILRFDFSLEDGQAWKLGKFLKSCGINTDGMSFGEVLPETRNAQVRCTLIHKPDKRDQSIIYNNIGKLAGTYDV